MSFTKRKKETYQEEERARHCCCCVWFRSLPNGRLRYCPLLVPAFYTWSLVATSNSPGRFFCFFFSQYILSTKLKNHFEQRMQSKQWRRGNSETREKQGRFKKEGCIQHISCPGNLLLFRISTQKIPLFPSGKNEEMLLTITFFIYVTRLFYFVSCVVWIARNHFKKRNDWNVPEQQGHLDISYETCYINKST
jgi:hypothetical protein